MNKKEKIEALEKHIQGLKIMLDKVYEHLNIKLELQQQEPKLVIVETGDDDTED
jgi:hypothetical protein